MARPLSMLLTDLVCDAEISSSFYNALDAKLAFGQITREEHTLCAKALRRVFKTFDIAHPTFTAKKNAVKQFIKEAAKNESLYAR